jgi:hypothetical protein
VSAQTYITPTLLAILAYPSFRLLYDPVANSSLDVANLQRQCKRAGNFNVVFQGLNFGKKSPLVKRLNLHRATLPLFLFALSLPHPAEVFKAMWV